MRLSSHSQSWFGLPPRAGLRLRVGDRRRGGGEPERPRGEGDRPRRGGGEAERPRRGGGDAERPRRGEPLRSRRGGGLRLLRRGAGLRLRPRRGEGLRSRRRGGLREWRRGGLRRRSLKQEWGWGMIWSAGSMINRQVHTQDLQQQLQ